MGRLELTGISRLGQPSVNQIKKPHAGKAWSIKGLLQSVSEDDRPVTILASDRDQINEKAPLPVDILRVYGDSINGY
jgi:hypothetical protein